MEEQNVNEEVNNATSEFTPVTEKKENLPTKVSVWTKIKNFFCQDVEVTSKNPKTQEGIKKFDNFLSQEIDMGQKLETGKGFKNFWLQKVGKSAK